MVRANRNIEEESCCTNMAVERRLVLYMANKGMNQVFIDTLILILVLLYCL